MLRAGGATPDEARITADHLVLANLSGHDSHGIGLLPGYCNSLERGTLVPNRTPEIVQSSGALAVWDGHGGFGSGGRAGPPASCGACRPGRRGSARSSA